MCELVNADAFSRCRGNAASRGKSEPTCMLARRCECMFSLWCVRCRWWILKIWTWKRAEGCFPRVRAGKRCNFCMGLGALPRRFHHQMDWYSTLGSCSARLGTPLLVGGNAPSAERDKRGGSWEMQRRRNVQRSQLASRAHSRPRNKGEIHQALNYAKSCVGFSLLCVPDPIMRPLALTSRELSGVCVLWRWLPQLFLMPRRASTSAQRFL